VPCSQALMWHKDVLQRWYQDVSKPKRKIQGVKAGGTADCGTNLLNRRGPPWRLHPHVHEYVERRPRADFCSPANQLAGLGPGLSCRSGSESRVWVWIWVWVRGLSPGSGSGSASMSGSGYVYSSRSGCGSRSQILNPCFA
jgi:hypothetical protein